MTLIFAHRGSAGTHPENTMDAFLEAERVKADGIELDVQLTKDGEVVVIHDETVDRTTNGKGYVKDSHFKDLRKLHANYTFKKKYFHKHKIPTLEEVFDWMKENQLVCNIELKNSIIEYEGLEEKVIDMINRYSYTDRTVISSFNHYSIVACKQLDPSLNIAPLYSNGLYMPWLYAKSLGAEAIHPNQKVASDDIVIDSMKNGIAVRPYTVNKETQMKRFFAVGCSAIVTDYPERAIAVRGG
ncbi:glycerophosphodiester phosphodiesterase [Rossellomorea aquimaris]|uniref:glycerophosphodiester phosphodiesterase n=1 Tax=Rossellomorea aquimaris TaxID=189382 RepID=UPI001CD58B3E|nr:glycerophosphodiester phosphodiesterase [Rossellomorea aquimaris]MCA1054766.1 glycerophosphodiester phosphodiesterase [Rossellomorea aquimaris]